MATYGSTLRRGLPRRPGDDAWPPAGNAPSANGDAPPQDGGTVASEATSGVTPPAAATATVPADTSAAAPATAETPPAAAEAPANPAHAAPVAAVVTLRRGLPRQVGGDPWPPAATAQARAAGAADAPADAAAGSAHGEPASAAATALASAAPASSVSSAPPASSATPADVEAPSSAAGTPLRRGLPRTAGGDAWPPAGTVAAAPAERALPEKSAAPAESALAAPAAPASTPAEALPAPTDVSGPVAVAPATASAAGVVPASGPRPPLTAPRTVWPGRAATHRPSPPPEPKRLGPFTRGQWLGIVVVGGGGLLFAAAMAVLLVRVLLSMPFGQDFLAAYPGEYHLPEGAPVGFPAWLGWQHFFNVFLMVLIIRSGITIRTEKRPTVFWTPKRNKKGKTSLTIWFHQSLDVLWLVNGVVFVVLLFITGQWMRIVPTSWEVFPNALSAALQYVSLDWPTENGWVNYNALQQLAYFTTVFLAAPLAAITGYRMSGLWPKKNARLSSAFPIEWARRVHFPVMLYFVAFIIVHVALVFATGALRNLNHMYAAQGSVDGTAYADNWTGFWIFVASMVAIAAAWIAARPLTLAPLARLFGTVSGR